MAGRLITNMHGLTLKVVSWRFYLSFPHLEGCTQLVMDRDSRTGQYITSIYTDKEYYMATYNPYYDLWVLYHLKYINYNELEDIRKSYIHDNKYHS